MRPACLLACLLAAPAAAADRPCVVFCVGIEMYDDPSLNVPQLQPAPESVAEDAVAVWNRLHEITRVDDKRSRLIVTDRVPKGNATLPAGPRQKRDRLPFADLHAELREFLTETTKDDLVVIYLGGHGEKREDAPAAGVYYLASDYRRAADKQGILNGLPVSDLLRMLYAEYSFRKQGAEVVVFANMCYAGAPVEQELDVVPGGLRPPKLAYIPACGDVKTYELPGGGRSVFADRLLAALGGKGSDGERVTARSVLGYLQTDRDIRAPQPVALPAEEIVIGTVLPEQVRARRMLAHTLLAAGLDAGADDREMFIRLAESHYEKCARADGGLAADQLSRIQCRLFLGGSPAEHVKWLRAAVAQGYYKTPDPAADPLIRKLVDQKADPKPEVRPFVAVVIEVRDRFSQGASDVVAPPGKSETWQNFLSAAPGRLHVEAFTPDDTFVVTDAAARLQQLVAAARARAGNQPADLILVYNGPAGSSEDQKRVVQPITADDLAAIGQGWPADRRCVVVWDAPFGGLLKSVVNRPGVGDRVSLLMAASQPNGMKYGGPQGTTQHLIQAIREGGSGRAFRDAHERLVKQIGSQSGAEYGYQVGLPAWVGSPHPAFGGGPDVVREALGDFGIPGRWWAGEFALFGTITPAGKPRRKCAMDEEEYCGASLKERAACLRGARGNDPFAHLELATLYEILRQPGDAIESYAFFEKARPAATNVPEVLRGPRTAARTLLAELQKGARSREAALAEVRDDKTPAPRVHFVPVWAQDYESPRIGDLGGTRRDVEQWHAVLRDRFGEQVKAYLPVGKRVTAADARARLAEACEACCEHDQVVFVFSGRGLQTSVDRYLVTEDARPLAGPRDPDPTDPGSAEAGGDYDLFLNPDSVVRMKDVSAAFARARGACLAVLDCQFSRPDADARDILDKHLASVAGNAFEPLRRPGADRPLRAIPQPVRPLEISNATNHTYIWWIGTLSEPDNGLPPDPDRGAGPPRPKAVSPFSQSLLETLRTARDYRDWVNQAQKSIGNLRQSFDGSGARFATQGPLGHPVLTPTGGGLPLRLLVADYYPRRHTLDLGIDLASLPVLNRPDDAITQAALLVHRARLKRAEGVGETAEHKADADLALRMLDGLGKVDNPIPQELVDLFVLVRSGAIELRDGPAAAAEDLRGWANRRDLGEVTTPAVARRLIKLTQDAVRQDTTRLIRASREAVRAAPSAGFADRELQRLSAEVQGPLDQVPFASAVR